jgi:hypothetical protein
LAELRSAPLSFRPSPRAARDRKLDDPGFQRAGQSPEPLEDDLEGEEARPVREGLPSSYKMRHDPHYVEQLATRPRPAIPAAVFTDLTEHLGAIGACLHLFGERDRPLRERVAMELVQAEVHRAAWLSQALGVLAGDPAVVTNSVDLGALVDRLLASFAPEGVLAGVEFTSECEGRAHVVRGDEQLLVIGVAGLISGVHALVERRHGARVRVKIGSGTPGRMVRIDVSQDEVTLPPNWRTRFFDMAWAERPGGMSVGTRLAAARRVAELHSGSVQLVATDIGGCTLTMTIPRG